MLIGAADTPEGASWQALGIEENGLVLRLRFRHVHDQYGFALNGFRADIHPHRLVKDAAALGGDFRAQFFGLVDAFHLIRRKQSHFFTDHAQ